MVEKIILYTVREESKQNQALAAGKWNLFHGLCKYNQLMGLEVQPQSTFCYLYTHLCLETVFAALKLKQNYDLHYNINISS